MRELRVLEMAGGIAAAYCGRMFAATGAEVVLVEPLDGAPTRGVGPWIDGASGARRSASHEYLDAGKRSVVLDDAALDDAFRWADLVVSTCDGDLDATRDLHARIVAADRATCHVVLSGFGITGPYAGWRSSELVDFASGGYLYITGEPGREPLQGGGPWATYLAGMTAAVGAQVAVIDAARTGEAQLVDVGAMESVASGHQWTLTMYTHTGAIKGRWARRFGESFHPMGMCQAGDGRWLAVGAASRDQWENFCITTDTVELMADDDLYAPANRFERADEIDAAIAPWLAARTAVDAVAELQANRVPASLVQDYAEAMRSDQLAARPFLVPRPDLGADVQGPDRPFRIGEPGTMTVPRPLGADTDAFRAEIAAPASRGALPSIDLAQIRVIEFTLAWAGPLAGRTLADLGLDVVKVEHPGSRGMGVGGGTRGDEPWEWGQLAPPSVRAEIFPNADPGERRWNRMGIWNKMNRSKRSLCLDAKPDDGAAALAALISDADLLVHNFTPRGAQSLGIHPERLEELNARMGSVAMTGYGETGPMASHSSYGPMLLAYAGFDEATGYIGEGPLRMGLAMPDAVGGLHGAFALLAALWERELTGASVHIDMSQLETLLAFAGESLLATSASGAAPARHGNRSQDHAPQGVYRCTGDDAWLAVTVQGDAEWKALLDVIGTTAFAPDADLAARHAAHDEIDAVIAAWAADRSALDAAAALQTVGIAACPAFTNRDLVENEHLAERGFMAEWDQPDVGPQRFPGFPIHFDGRHVDVRAAPALGADNESVLGALGFDDAHIAALLAAGVIATEPPA